MTSLVARTVATRFLERARPIRLSYSGEVFRWDEPRGGRQYEFHQIGLEHIGSSRLESDIEVLVIAIEALKRLGIEGFTITLSHVDFFNGVAERLKLESEERRRLREMIDRKETERLGSFLEPYTDAPSREAFCRLATLAGKREIISEARSLISNPRSSAALDEIERVYNTAQALSVDSYIDIDLGEVGGLDYYTGLTFKIYAPGLGTALGRGGRYDQLLANFGLPEPAVGFSLCLDWLTGLIPPELSGAAAGTVAPVKLSASSDIVSAFKQAKQLRAEGRSVEIT
jgi:ATP phosphoribosyltransferase regulatory subunit